MELPPKLDRQKKGENDTGPPLRIVCKSVVAIPGSSKRVDKLRGGGGDLGQQGRGEGHLVRWGRRG